jgi:hypothetical protein
MVTSTLLMFNAAATSDPMTAADNDRRFSRRGLGPHPQVIIE